MNMNKELIETIFQQPNIFLLKKDIRTIITKELDLIPRSRKIDFLNQLKQDIIDYNHNHNLTCSITECAYPEKYKISSNMIDVLIEELT